MNIRRVVPAAALAVGAVVGLGVGTASAASYAVPQAGADTVDAMSYEAPRSDDGSRQADILTPWEKFCLLTSEPGDDIDRCLNGQP